MKKNLLIIGTLILVLASCKKDPTTDNSNPPTIELGTNTIIIDTSTAPTVQSIDSTHIVFNGSTSQLQRLAIGNIIISAPTPNAPVGFFRKISSIIKNGSIYTFLTTEANLIESFKTLHVDFTTPASTFSISPSDIILYDLDGNNMTTYDQMKVNVNSSLIPKFHIKIDITNFGLDYAKIDGNFEGTLNTSITAGGSIGSISKEINIYSQPIGIFTIPATPIVISASLRVSLGASGSINTQIVASDTKNSNINAFIEYKNSNWDKGFVRTMDNQFTFSGLSGIASAKVYIEPAIDFKLWGSNWAKGSITSQGYLKATGQLLPTPDCELKAGISAGAEANLKFFGANFSATSYPEIFDFSKILYTCSAPNTQLPTISTTSVTGITNNSATSGGNVTSIGASTVTAKGVCWNVSPHPTIANSSTTNGTNTGSFNSSITGLLPNTTYYVRAYATNAQGTNYGNEITFTTQPNSLTVTDIDGNVYTTVTIGTQTWMVENLKVTHYRNGDIIPNITDATQWGNLTTGGWCYYNNDVQNNNIYGKLYNWFTVSDTRNVSPTGWHIPTDADWTTLATFLGGMSIAGGKMKATTLWNSPNSGATNTSGFTGYPNGWRGITGSFNSFGTNGDWWAFGLDGTGNPLGRGLYFGDAQLYLDGGIIKQSGYAIRCIKD